MFHSVYIGLMQELNNSKESNEIVSQALVSMTSTSSSNQFKRGSFEEYEPGSSQEKLRKRVREDIGTNFNVEEDNLDDFLINSLSSRKRKHHSGLGLWASSPSLSSSTKNLQSHFDQYVSPRTESTTGSSSSSSSSSSLSSSSSSSSSSD